MNEEKIIDAMEFIDDSFIEDVYALKSAPEKHKIVWLKYVGIAACVMLVVGLLSQNVFDYVTTSDSNNFGFTGGSTDGTVESANDKTEEYANDAFNDMVTNVVNDDNTGNTSGSTGETVGAVAGSSSDSSSVYAGSPAYVEIVEITDNGFVLKFSNSENLVNAVYGENYKSKEDFKVGDKVYITYGIDSKDSSRICIYNISYEEV